MFVEGFSHGEKLKKGNQEVINYFDCYIGRPPVLSELISYLVWTYAMPSTIPCTRTDLSLLPLQAIRRPQHRNWHGGAQFFIHAPLKLITLFNNNLDVMLVVSAGVSFERSVPLRDDGSSGLLEAWRERVQVGLHDWRGGQEAREDRGSGGERSAGGYRRSRLGLVRTAASSLQPATRCTDWNRINVWKKLFHFVCARNYKKVKSFMSQSPS